MKLTDFSLDDHSTISLALMYVVNQDSNKPQIIDEETKSFIVKKSKALLNRMTETGKSNLDEIAPCIAILASELEKRTEK